MPNPRKILIYHPGAIGDVMLATPVAAALKAGYPSATIVHCTHPSLFGLLELCAHIDEVADSGKQFGVLKQRAVISGHRADLLVDLSGSSRSHMLTFLMPSRVLHYRKQSAGTTPIQHAVDNFLATLAPLGLPRPAEPFPSISPTPELIDRVAKQYLPQSTPDRPFVALVPGVGSLRSHRAWIADGWSRLMDDISGTGKHIPVLVGGPDDSEVAQQVASAAEKPCINLVGKLTLAETATALKLCRAVVSGDTGPAHIAVAVGTPVIGLYGPTYFRRSGPYGYDSLTIDVSNHCQCHNVKLCRLTSAPGPGECMRQLAMSDVWGKLKQVLPDL